jgi:hypothetical protein
LQTGVSTSGLTIFPALHILPFVFSTPSNGITFQVEINLMSFHRNKLHSTAFMLLLLVSMAAVIRAQKLSISKVAQRAAASLTIDESLFSAMRWR